MMITSATLLLAGYLVGICHGVLAGYIRLKRLRLRENIDE